MFSGQFCLFSCGTAIFTLEIEELFYPVRTNVNIVYYRIGQFSFGRFKLQRKGSHIQDSDAVICYHQD